MLLMLAWACHLMLLMLAWACRLHMSQHDCLSLSGKEFICWIKTALRDMLDQNCSRQCCSLHFLFAMANLTAAEIHFCVSSCELRVASPARARAFVPARGSQVCCVLVDLWHSGRVAHPTEGWEPLLSLQGHGKQCMKQELTKPTSLHCCASGSGV